MTQPAAQRHRFNLEKATIYLDHEPLPRLRVLAREGDIGHFCRTIVRVVLSHHDCDLTQDELLERAREALARRWAT